MKNEGAFVEVKEKFAQNLIQDLAENVQTVAGHYSKFQLIGKSNCVEVSPKNLNKGMILELILQKEQIINEKLDFALIIAIRIEKEDIFSHFKVIIKSKKYFIGNGNKFSVSLGLVPSYVNYYINFQIDLIQLLKKM
ncbi:unnamed protein product [Paramecium sonneborni]|uniref:Uncharacterized protein n=1 Tax=Paramecium sonneborni TaxID=65129 RepID=A0A8S1QN98_9CILI|nr:unnamed protein product [Paramecium sonneborni]